MRSQTCIKIVGAFLATAVLAACGGNDNGSAASNSAQTNSFESRFGADFAKFFDASSTSVPATPDSNAVPALAPASQPLAVP